MSSPPSSGRLGPTGEEDVGFAVEQDQDAALVESAGSEAAFDLALVDLHMPGTDGLALGDQVPTVLLALASRPLPWLAIGVGTAVDQVAQADVETFVSELGGSSNSSSAPMLPPIWWTRRREMVSPSPVPPRLRDRPASTR